MTKLTDWKVSLLKDAPDRMVANKVISAIQRLFEFDSDLLIHDLHEQTITGNLACHLRSCFLKWHVDCEYNRDGHEIKKANGKMVKPDIVVHRRGQPKNLLVIEVKKSNSQVPDDEDIKKLRDYCDGSLRYKVGLFLKFTVGDCAPRLSRIKWVKDHR
jgi:hypothetical protein